MRSPSVMPVASNSADILGMSRTQSSKYDSIFKRPMIQPATIATLRPSPKYSSATFQPNMPNKRVSATSLTIGAEIRNENVTPSGTPAVTKPMNRGTAEQEQNGVTMPSSAASTLPSDSRLPVSILRVRSGVKNERMTPTAKTTSVKS